MSEALDTDVLVVGGGPAGLAAAIAVRQQGLRVTVADCASPPIDKACGEGLMPDSLEVLRRLGVRLEGIATGRFRGIKFLGPEGSVTADFPRGEGVGVRRVRLHELFVQHAEAAGAELLWNARVLLADGFTVKVNGRTIRSRWLIGADGQNSRVRDWAGLSAGRLRARRIALRQHFRVRPWSEYVEIYWGNGSQAYVTPVGDDQICVALISRERFASFEDGLTDFPELVDHLAGAAALTNARGALSISRRLQQVWRDRVALIGEASGSVDAITGEGLAMGFRQALALAQALVSGDLSSYARAHREISSLPEFMARTMLLLDSSAVIRRRALSALSHQPDLFSRMLSVHVGELRRSDFGARDLLNLGWQMLVA